MAATSATEIGDLLFRNFDQHVDRTIHHSATIEKPNNFKDALEMYCYRNKIHKLQNPAALLYMIMGYLSTYPRKKRIGVKNIFLSRDEEMIKVLAQRAAKAGLGPKSSSELQILIKSFCLGAQRRATFLPFPEVDPSILGIRSINRLPLLLMKLAVDVRQNELLGDLRTVYIRDQRFMKKKQ
uniref:Uncharacterized protein n=1 Tax=Romanomermis culicivorax TaxID=13658 RepID=A0A915LCU1_ROMCU